MPLNDSCISTDAGLIKACAKQDRKAQRIIYEKYAPRMFFVCMRYVSDRDVANDLLQEGFITIFSKIESFNGDGSFEGWMRKVFANTALMHLRKKDVLRDTKDISELKTNIPFVDDILDNIDIKDIYSLIKGMPDGFRIVFNMNVIDGFSHKEIAEKLKISEGASRSQLSRARTWLQERIILMEKERK